MFINLLQLILRRSLPPEAYELAFVREVAVHEAAKPRPPRNRAMERILLISWALIVIKCVLVWWLVRHYAVPVEPLWVIAPTLLMAVACTLLYRWRW